MAAVTITKPTCNSINIVNNLNQIVNYIVKKFDSTTLLYTAISGGTGQLGTLGLDVTFELVDGIYKIEIDPAVDADEIYIKTIFCSLEECYVSLFTKAVCEGLSKACCSSCANKNKVNLSNFQLLLQVYFSILKKYENFDSPFTTLDSEVTDSLVKLSKVEKNLSKYCSKSCNCGCN